MPCWSDSTQIASAKPGAIQITQISEGFDFLGWNARQFAGTLITQPSKKNVKAFLDKIRSTLAGMKSARQVDVIEKLTPIIRGWANYHRSQMSSKTFARCDHQIWQVLWRWAKRRHPNKGARWIKKRYFKFFKGRDWQFADQGKVLPFLAGYHKRPYTKVKSEANPYDPKYDKYFSSRLALKMDKTLEGRRKLRWLWWLQEGICPVCQQKITRETGWHLHHIIKRSQHGSDKLSNLILLHPNCHRQHHVVESIGTVGISMFK
jgi:RNA-directed DNA polymerase